MTCPIFTQNFRQHPYPIPFLLIYLHHLNYFYEVKMSPNKLQKLDWKRLPPPGLTSYIKFLGKVGNGFTFPVQTLGPFWKAECHWKFPRCWTWEWYLPLNLLKPWLVFCLGFGSPGSRPWDKDLSVCSSLGSDLRKHQLGSRKDKEGAMSWIVFPQNSYVEVLNPTPIPQNATLFGNRILYM